MINKLHESIPQGRIIILDVQCNDDKLLNYNISCKSNNNDYKDKDYSMAIRDFKARSLNYKKLINQLLVLNWKIMVIKLICMLNVSMLVKPLILVTLNNVLLMTNIRINILGMTYYLILKIIITN